MIDEDDESTFGEESQTSSFIFKTKAERDAFVLGLDTAKEMIDDDHLSWEIAERKLEVKVGFIV